MESRLVEFVLYLMVSGSALLVLLNIPRFFTERKTSIYAKLVRLSFVFLILSLLPAQWLAVDYLKMKSSDIGFDGVSIILWSLGVIIPLSVIYFYKWVIGLTLNKRSD